MTAKIRVKVSPAGVSRWRRPSRASSTAPTTVTTTMTQWVRPYGLKVTAAAGRSTPSTLEVAGVQILSASTTLWQSHPPRGWCRWRGNHRADVPVGSLVQGHKHRSVIAWAGALACLPVHPRCPHPLGDRCGGQHEVDAHPQVLVEHASAIVPVREHPFALPALPHDISKPNGLNWG